MCTSTLDVDGFSFPSTLSLVIMCDVVVIVIISSHYKSTTQSVSSSFQSVVVVVLAGSPAKLLVIRGKL